jgi:hypothetical protein
MRLPAILAPALLLLTSCASYLQREFVVEALNTQEAAVDALVLLEDEVVAPAEGREVRTPATITVRFKRRSDGAGYESVKLGVKAVKVGEEGKVIHGLRRGEASEYHEDFRALYPFDAKRQLFILHRRRAGS